MRFTKESAAAILAFTSTVAALPHASQVNGESAPTARPKWHAGGFANHTHAVAITHSHNVSSSSTHAATTTHQHDKMIGLAMQAEEGPVFDGLGCIVNCWVENRDPEGSGDKAAYGECINHCKTPTNTPSTSEHASRNMTDSEHAHKVTEAATEVGAKLRNDIVDYFKCMLEEESQECIGAIMTRYAPKSGDSRAQKGWIEYGTEEATMPAINTTTTQPVDAASTTKPVHEPSKTKETVTRAWEATAIDGGMEDAPASSSVVSVTGRPSPYPVEA